jgi:copper chaperone CopZ
MKRLSLILLGAMLLLSVKANSQVKEAVIGVDGFTCSLCAKGVEGQLKGLDFVKSVKADLKETTFTLTFYSDKNIKLSELRDAITDGGFSLRDITITADGTLSGDAASGFSLSTGNSPNLNLKNSNGEFTKGDKVKVSGKVSLPNTVNISSMKKL